MCPGFNGDPQAMDDLRKTAVIDRELHRLCVDVAALQETRLTDDGTLREQNYTFFWQGKKAEELRIHGVGLAVKNSLLSTLEPPTGRTERLLNLKMFTRTGVVNLVCAYAPTLCSTTEEALQRLIDRFALACDDFGLTISIKKTEVLGQGTTAPPNIRIGSQVLNAVERFQYLGSTISSNLSLEPEISSRIAKASAVMSKLHKRVWSNNNLTVNTKMQVYKACVLSTLLYSSESWTSYAAQERRLNTFHLRCLRRILGIKWQDRIPNTDVLEQAGLPTIFTLLSQRRLRWLGHVRRMKDGRIPKDLL